MKAAHKHGKDVTKNKLLAVSAKRTKGTVRLSFELPAIHQKAVTSGLPRVRLHLKVCGGHPFHVCDVYIVSALGDTHRADCL